jgi:MoaA/NifB/PqqE/SkfB family radical SAM enzyme
MNCFLAMRHLPSRRARLPQGSAFTRSELPQTGVSLQLRRLPLVTLYATDRCNSRCVTCDYWRHGRTDATLGSVLGMLPALNELQTQVVLLSGGEPLLNPEWPAIAEALRANGQRVWLLTSGLSLLKHTQRAAELFDNITVSLDGTNAQTYQAIRGLDAFDKVCAGIRAIAAAGVPPTLRVTLQRANYRQLPQFVTLARQLGAAAVSFLPVDVSNPHAFGRSDDFAKDLALGADDLPALEQLLTELEREEASSFDSGFIAENPQKLRRILQYFRAQRGLGEYPPVRCNAPEFSAVIAANGAVQPCFFIDGPTDASQSNLQAAINGESMQQLREVIRAGGRPECKSCVCHMWRDPEQIRIAPRSARFAALASV